MNVLGIDYQQTLSVLSLREGRGLSAPTTSIGDGRRVLVPHAVTAARTWGSDALSSASETCLQPLDPMHDGPWLDTPGAEVFWQGLYARLVRYLGRVKPTFANGYQTTIALQGGDWDAMASGVQRLCAQAGQPANDAAGLREATCIAATEALLCRWLSAPALFAPVPDPDATRAAARRKGEEALPAESVVAVVAVGDSSTLVGAYRVKRAPGGQWHIAARPADLQHIAVGLSGWQAHLLVEVSSRFREPCDANDTLELRDSALDFAWQITQASEVKELTWRGACQERMYAPLCLTRTECAHWPATQQMQASLPAALARAASALGRSVRLDRILVGGVGALWPFVGEIAGRVAPAWSSATPQTDIAFGAAAWSEFAVDVAYHAAPTFRIEPAGTASPPQRSTPSARSAPVETCETATQPVDSSPAPAIPAVASTAVLPPTLSAPAGQPIAEDLSVAKATTPKPGDTPPPHRAPVDGDEWNAPEPGMVPPWERE
jgi:hypothetical protein